ncbi:serpin B3 [Anabrus simplex]|uniref:serpin B3 n=1 Tax=Anabrus simplex TaxID=316456 RepID=UPI0035A39315
MLIAVFLISSLFAGQGYADSEMIWKILDGVNNFGSELYQELSKKHASFVSSPLSADLALAMLMVGAGNDMFQKMASVLHVQGNRTLVEDGYRTLAHGIMNHKRNVTLEIANKLYVDKRNAVKSEYQQAVKTIFQSDVEQVDFDKENEVVENVNNWTKSATHGKIEKLIDHVSNETVAIGLNAVYFYGEWKTQFNPDHTREEVFHLNSKSSKSIPMMALKSDRLLFMPYPDFDVLKLYYKGEDTSMLILLPREIDGLAALESKLSTLNITRISQALIHAHTEVLLPKFKIESSLDLSEPLEKMGLGGMFTFSREFSPITNKQFKITSVTQKAFIEVTEKGTEAAAATAWVGGTWPLAPPLVQYFRADHPFMFIILDELTGGSLFFGRFTGQE